MEVSEIDQTEVMAGVHTETCGESGVGGFDKRSYRSFGILRIEVGVWFGVKLDAVSTRSGCKLHVLDVSTHKNRRADTTLAQTVDNRRKELHVLSDIPART